MVITTTDELVEALKALTESSEAARECFATDPGGSMDYFAVLAGSPLSHTEQDRIALEAFTRMGW